jgi:hypothetical protein
MPLIPFQNSIDIICQEALLQCLSLVQPFLDFPGRLFSLKAIDKSPYKVLSSQCGKVQVSDVSLKTSMWPTYPLFSLMECYGMFGIAAPPAL